MRTAICLSLFLMACWVVSFAQAPPLVDSNSSRGTYELAEVLITTRQHQNGDQRLVHFYQAVPVATTEEVLQRLPGLSLIRRGSYAQEPVLRGLNTAQVSLTIDGMRMFEACTDKMDPLTAYVEPNNLAAIEVQAGPQGGLMGASTGGNLDFRLQKARYADSARWQGFLSARSQTVAPGIAARAGLAYTAPRAGLRTSLVYRRQGWYRAPGGARVPYSQYEKANWSVAGQYRLGPRSEVLVDLLGDHAFNVGYTALPMDVAFAHALIGAVTWRQRPQAPAWPSWELKVYHNRIDHAMDDSQRDSVAMRMDMPGYTRTSGAYWQARWLPHPRHLVQLKADLFSSYAYAEMTMYPEGEQPMFMLTWPGVQRQVAGLYVADRYQWRPRWRVNTSLRVEAGHTQVREALGMGQLQIFFPDFAGRTAQPLLSTRLELSGRPAERWETGALLAYGERMPTISEQFGYYLFSRLDGYDYLGQPGLRKEKAGQVEANLRYRQGGLEVEVTGFGYRFFDYIQAQVWPGYSAMTIGAAGVKRYENLPGALLAGGEARLTWTPLEQWQVHASGQYTYGRDYRGRPLPLIPPWQVQGAVRWAGRPLTLQVEASWNAAQFRISEVFGENMTPAFWLVHLRASRSFSLGHQRLSLSGGVENLLDAAYWHHLDWGDFLRPGRNVYLNLDYAF